LQLLIPYFSPYALYVAIEAIPTAWLSPEVKQVLKLVVVSIALVWSFKWYRFGKLSKKHVLISMAAAPMALLLWVMPLYFFQGPEQTQNSFSPLYVTIRTLNSTFLVAIFEELFIRVYLLQLFFQAGRQLKAKGFVDAIFSTFEQHPRRLEALPISLFSVTLATVAFTVGHTLVQWPSAILYFLFTTYVYWKSNSIWVCILMHGMANLAIALLVGFGGMGFLW